MVFLLSFVYADDSPSLLDDNVLRDEAVQSARQGNFTKALDTIKQALRKNKDSPQITSDYIVILSWSGNCEESIKVYEQFPYQEALSEYALPEVAKCYRIIARYDSAIKLYTQYLNKKSNDKTAITGLIYTYMDANQVEAARAYIKELLRKHPQDSWVEMYLADILLREDKLDEAEAIYSKWIKNDPHDIHPQLGLCRIFIKKHDYIDAEKIVNNILLNNSNDIEALFCKGEVLEAKGEFFSAYKIYEKILEIYPNSSNARNLKYRALMELGSNSLVRDTLRQTNDFIDPELEQTLSGNEAMERIWWLESKEALVILNQNSADTSFPEGIHMRSLYDRILSLRALEYMEEVIRQYKMLESMKTEIPPWIIVSAADAYLYLQKPQTALELYREALKKKWDQNGNTEMAIYYTLVELGRYKEAEEILDLLDKERPVQIVERGELRDNWRKEEVVYNRGWWYLYQDRLAEGNRYIEGILSVAPFDTNMRTALAHTYLWRGWPRLSLQEFKITLQIDPEDLNALMGHCYALDENDQGEEARRLAKELLKKTPKNKHLQQLNRYFKVQDMRTLTAGAAISREHPGVDQLYWFTKLEQPIFPWRKIFTEFVWRYDNQDDQKYMLRRGYAGVDWRLNRDWWLVGSLSEDTKGENFGYSSKLTFNPDDYFSFITSYDSYSLNVPLRARVFGIKAREWNFTARYRQSESFTGKISTNYLRLSDGNIQDSNTLLLDKAITTAAYWKTRVVLEANSTTYSKVDVSYYSPKHVYTLYATPMIEHVWYKRYQKAFIDRLFMGAGAEWQKDFSAQAIWHARYEQDYKISDTLFFLWGATYSKRNYDGQNSGTWSYDIAIKFNF